MKKFLVTTDGSDNARDALLEAKTLAECANANIVIMHVIKDVVVNPYATIIHDSMHKNNNSDKLAAELLEDSLKLFVDFKGEIKTKLVKGNPADEIIKEAELENYDLIVMGSRGLGTFSRAMLGSISNKVLNHVKANVLIVK